MPDQKSSLSQPAGIAFELADLVMAQAWAALHALRMVVELDHCADDDEYEEVLAFYPPDSAFRRWMIWRGARGIVVQPMVGRAICFPSVVEALERMIPGGA